ncbi:TPA: DNA-processing protein DprA [Acinetobacter baumannii]
MLTQLSSHQYHTLKVWYLVQHSLVSFKKIIDYFGNCEKATQPDGLAKWSSLGLHANHLKRVNEFQTPQGQAQALLQPQIAIVGSRKPSPHGRQVAYDFAYYLSEKGFFISSGLAYGIDEAAHQGASAHQRTIAVTGTGLDTTYPAQNKKLAEHILAQNGAIITEFLPGTPPLQQHFPRRNRIVSGLSLGVLVVEATLKSGSLITANKAAEQGKTVFAIPGHIYSEFHQGCHQLIREGAILIDHPEQIIEDLALPTQWQSQQQNQTEEANTNTPEIPEHLIDLYQSLDWVGQNIDQLVIHHNVPVSELTSSLMELELLGLCMQQSGLYLRCRS